MGLKLKDISYIKNKEILKNISLEINDNLIYGIIGNGKTTILNIIVGLLKPTDGIVKNIYKEIGYLKEEITNHFINITLSEEIKTYGKVNKLDQILEIIPISELLNKNIYNLNYYNQKKVALFLALIKRSKLLLLDEPFSGLNLKQKEEMIKIIRKIKKELNIPIIISTNDIDSLHKIVDYIYVIDKGIVLEGTKYDVFKEQKLLNKHNISIPQIIEFEMEVLEKKNIKIGYRDEINDLIKDIYRYAK